MADLPPDVSDESTLRHRRLAVGALVLLGLAAYWNSLTGPFVFDDLPAIKDNVTIRSLWPITGALSPPQASGVGGRPIANLSFALNYALTQDDVRGFHAGNVLLHLVSTLLLFGIVRRTLRAVAPAVTRRATALGFAIAGCWGVHPLTTAAVSYLSQRTEVLMGSFYLLTLYAFIRGVDCGRMQNAVAANTGASSPAAELRRRGRHALAWPGVSVGACALGMMSKEVMVTAPVLVLLYDRAFFSGSFGNALRRRWPYYSGLAASWLGLAWVLTTGLEQRSVGFGLGVSALQYALSEARAVWLYVRLAFVPHPLVFDYGPVYAPSVAAAVPLVALVAFAAWKMFRGSRIGFVAVAFFLLLAPTSSFVPVAEQPIAENRMYLPLAALMVVAVMTCARAIGRGWSGTSVAAARQPVLVRYSGVAPVLFALGAAMALTVARNRDFRSELALWSDTVAKRPQNWRANFNCGVALLDLGRAADAADFFRRAIVLRPTEAKAHNSLGNALLVLERVTDAIASFEEAVRLNSSYGRAWYNLGTALFGQGQVAPAIVHFERAIALEPALAEAHTALGNGYFQLNQPQRALAQYEASLRIDPLQADARYNAGSACLELGRLAEAVLHFTAAAKLKPADAEIRNNLAVALLREGRARDAIPVLEEALRLKPDYGEAKDNLAIARREAERR